MTETASADRALSEHGTDAKYRQQAGVVFLTGVEAIIRLLLEKQLRDQAGDGQINQTYITGYEGSPLGGLDLKVVENLNLLNERGRTVHQFGINEKTAASAMLGSQYAPSGDVDAFWYGKAHGTMWIPDELWLANLAGTSSRGSMVLLCGEDHRSKSSVSPGASDWVLRSSMVPVFYPASVGDILRLGMHAIQLSRYLGVVTALKLVTPLCDGASTVWVEEEARPQILLPDPGFRKQFNPIVMALGALPMQKTLVEDKLPLVEQYVHLNQLNTIHDADAGGEVGIIATGKSYVDVRAALVALDRRLPVLQLSVSYPLDNDTIRTFSRGLRRICVVEEPGPFVEDGVKAALWGSEVESVHGQYDEAGRPLIPSYGEIDPDELARRLWPRLGSNHIAVSNAFLTGLDSIASRRYPQIPAVSPMSCGGCPYNVFRDLKEKPGGGDRMQFHSGHGRLRQSGPLHPDDGSGWLDVQRHGGVQRQPTYLSVPGRRELLPQRTGCRTELCAGRRQHHLLAALQRSRGPDRWPGTRGQEVSDRCRQGAAGPRGALGGDRL